MMLQHKTTRSIECTQYDDMFTWGLKRDDIFYVVAREEFIDTNEV